MPHGGNLCGVTAVLALDMFAAVAAVRVLLFAFAPALGVPAAAVGELFEVILVTFPNYRALLHGECKYLRVEHLIGTCGGCNIASFHNCVFI